MELVIKLYNDRPSGIGVKYTHEYKALKEYETLISKYGNENFKLRMEPVKTGMNLYLEPEASGGRMLYKDLAYKPEQIKKLFAYYNAKMPFQFVHVFSKENTLYIAKPFRKPLFITVSGLEMIGPDNFTGAVLG